MRSFLCLISLAFVVGLTSAPTATAQEDFHFGALGGLDFATFSYTPQPAYDVSRNARGNAGVFFAFELNETLSLETRLLWVRKSVKTQYPRFVGAANAQVSYASIPVLLKATLDTPRVRPFLCVGPELLIKTAASMSGTVNGNRIEVSDFDDQVRPWDLTLDLGAGVEVAMGPVAVVLEGLYSRGVTNISTESDDQFEDVKTSTFRLSAGLRF